MPSSNAVPPTAGQIPSGCDSQAPTAHSAAMPSAIAPLPELVAAATLKWPARRRQKQALDDAPRAAYGPFALLVRDRATRGFVEVLQAGVAYPLPEARIVGEEVFLEPHDDLARH